VQDYIGAERTLWAVVKADAYGHGAVQATDALLQAGVAHFIVASLDEAVALREALPQRAFRLMTLYTPTSPDEWRTAEQLAEVLYSTDPISQLLSRRRYNTAA
jgi:alanine racemase (EC 5.1.1.1)